MIQDFIQKEKLGYIVILFVVCLISAIGLNTKLMEEPDNNKYTKAMELYRAEDYQNAYYNFSKVSCFSAIKQASIFRQARCATILGDNRTAIRNYYILLKRFPHSSLYAVSEYNLATLLYQTENERKALKHFKHLQKKFPDSEFAIASKYYIGRITKDKTLLIEYISLSPKGRFAQNAIELLDGARLTSAENLVIAESYMAQENYSAAEKYFAKTSVKNSWAKYAICEFKLGNIGFAKQLSMKGLKYYKSDINDVYDVIEQFVNCSDNKVLTINTLINLNPQGIDYLYYLLAGYMKGESAYTVYTKIFTKYPDSKFAADSLSKVFYRGINTGHYDEAIRLGRYHLSKYSNTNSAPAVMYWLGKIYEKKHQFESSKMYYKGVLKEYPDSYYALKSNAKLNNGEIFKDRELVEKPVVFPVKNSNEMKFAIRLAKLGDDDFVKELYKDDMFVQSWVEYNKGNYANSALIARDAMDAMEKKPDFTDTRWRLVYPLHYYHYIKSSCKSVNPIIIISIVKEESHFNPRVKSAVGALGLMQLMPQTANEIASNYGIPCDLYSPKTNIQLGCIYYSRIKHALDNKDTLAILAYNGGIGSVMEWKNRISSADSDDFIEKIPYPETQDYVKKVLKAYWSYSNIYN